MMLRTCLSLVRPWQVILALCLVYLAVIVALNHGDVKAFVTIGSCYATCDFSLDQGCAEGTENGYDGQYAYYIARDPGGSIGCMDVPAYRYQRILLPLLGRLLSLGVDGLIPVAFVLVNLIALVTGTALLERLLVAQEVSRWYALTYGLFFGVVVAVRLSTAEPLAYGLAILAIWLSRQVPERSWLIALVLLAAMLAKETTGVFVAGFVLWYTVRRRWRAAALVMSAVGIPFALWQLYLYKWIGVIGVGPGGGGKSSFELIPYNGVWRIYSDSGSLAVFLLLGGLFIPSVVIPSAWGVWVTLREVWGQCGRLPGVHLYTWLHLANAGILMIVPFSTYREFLGIFRFMVGMVITHVLYAALRYPGRRPLIYSTLWIVLLMFVVSG